MKRNSGLTLIELMITVAVAVVVLAMGIPAFNNLRANNRAITEGNSLIGALNIARNEAINQGVHTVICAKSNAAANNYTCGTKSDWTKGWIIFQDLNKNEACDSCGTTEKLVGYTPQFSSGATIVADVGTIRFNSLGERVTNAPGSADDPLTFTLTRSDTKGKQIRYVCVNTVGQIRAERTKTAVATANVCK